MVGRSQRLRGRMGRGELILLQRDRATRYVVKFVLFHEYGTMGVRKLSNSKSDLRVIQGH